MVEINAGPYFFQMGSFILSWHGLFSLIGVGSAVFLVGRWATLIEMSPDDIYSIAVWAIIGGIIGARLVHVIDNLGGDNGYLNSPEKIIAIWSGGIGVWGGILGGFLGGAIACKVMKYPLGIVADLTAPAMLFAQSVGRLGDIVNGEHCAHETGLFLGFVWTHFQSAAGYCARGIGFSVHPVIAYEILWNFLVLFIIWNLRFRMKPPGMLFALYLALYAVGRFLISFYREDRVWIAGLQEAHFIALFVLILTVPLLAYKARIVDSGVVESEVAELVPRNTRAERRRDRR